MWRDDAYVLDILVAAQRTQTYVQNVSWESFEANTMLQDAVVRRLKIIGQAARSVSSTYKAAHPNVPWQKMIGLRNLLIHEYFRVDRVWEVVQQDIPELIVVIEPLISPNQDQQEQP